MDESLIRNWNARIKPEDTVFHLGDFCYKGRTTFNFYKQQLNGNLILIKGNHDRNNGVKTVITNMYIKLGGYNFQLVHRPEDLILNDVPLVLCGHVHQNWKFREKEYLGFTPSKYRFINVGVDVWNFYPVEINEIIKAYKQKYGEI